MLGRRGRPASSPSCTASTASTSGSGPPSSSIDGGTVRLGDGHEVSPDLVVVGIGAGPDDRLAAAAGLATDNGVLVDARLRAERPARLRGRRRRQPRPPDARAGSGSSTGTTPSSRARHAAREMLGDDARYDRQPYFFTDQYDLGMEYVGHVGPDGYDEVVVRGDLAGARVFRALWLKGGRVVAGMHANDWDAIDHAARGGRDRGHGPGPRPVRPAGRTVWVTVLACASTPLQRVVKRGQRHR